MVFLGAAVCLVYWPATRGPFVFDDTATIVDNPSLRHLWPLVGGGLDGSGYYAGKLDIFNNVVYNWRSRTTDGGAHQVNFVNNYYKAGAASSQEYALNAQYGGFPGVSLGRRTHRVQR